MGMTDIAAAFLQGVGIIAVAAILHEITLRHCASKRCRTIATTVVFTVGVVGSMTVPIALQPGLLFDLRHVFLVLAATCGGWPVTLVSAVAAMAYRLWEGGAGVSAGVAGIIMSAAVGLILAYFGMVKRHTLLSRVVIGVAGNAAILSVFALPFPVAMTVLSKVGVPLALANFVGIVVAAEILNSRFSQIAREKELLTQAKVDALTQLANRRVFDEQGPVLAETISLLDKPCSVMIIDIDRFKSVNDTFGHPAGDEILRRIASIIAANARKGDLVARYGGEEIALVLPDQDAHAARKVADRIRQAVEDATMQIRGISLKVTVSIGFSSVRHIENAFSVALQEADEALYAAKEAGRNRVATAMAAEGKHFGIEAQRKAG